MPYNSGAPPKSIYKTVTITYPMLIIITTSLLFLTASALLILRFTRPNFRYFWLTAAGGALLAWISTWLWQARMPLEFQLLPWQPAELFVDYPSFLADGISWPLALSLTTLAVAVILTATVRADLNDPLASVGTLILTGFGVLAVTANNPLTLVLVWAAIDISELIILLSLADEPRSSERVVTAFSTRAAGIGLVLWANIVSVANHTPMTFTSIPPQAGLFLLIGAGLRLGVLPLHLPYPSESSLRRGSGTALRLIAAASSLVLLARIPTESVQSILTPFLLVLATFAGLYAGWTWLRAPDELSGRPFWMIGMASLAVTSALRGNAIGAAAWSCALVLAGGALFLSSVQYLWFNRALMIGAIGLSALPLSLTASGWLSNAEVFWPVWPFMLAVQALLVAGYIRHALRPGMRDSFESQQIWSRNVYPAGIVILLLTTLLLGLFGWDGAATVGVWIIGIIASLLTLGLVWAIPRLRILNPIRAHWVRPATSWLENLYRGLWDLYQWLARLSRVISSTLEGDGGIMWTLLFLALFISLMTQGK